MLRGMLCRMSGGLRVVPCVIAAAGTRKIVDLPALEVDVERHGLVIAIDLVGKHAADLFKNGAVRSSKSRQDSIIGRDQQVVRLVVGAECETGEDRGDEAEDDRCSIGHQRSPREVRAHRA